MARLGWQSNSAAGVRKQEALSESVCGCNGWRFHVHVWLYGPLGLSVLLSSKRKPIDAIWLHGPGERFNWKEDSREKEAS